MNAAFRSLNTAVRLGYKELEVLRHFDEFEDVVSDARYDLLLELQKTNQSQLIAFPGEPAGS